MVVDGLAEVALRDGGVGAVAEGGDDGTKHDAEQLSEHGNGDGNGNGRLGACAGEDGKARGDDAAHDHVGGHGGAHLHETHAHKLDGGTRGEAGRRVTEQDADDG